MKRAACALERSGGVILRYVAGDVITESRT